MLYLAVLFAQLLELFAVVPEEAFEGVDGLVGGLGDVALTPSRSSRRDLFGGIQLLLVD